MEAKRSKSRRRHGQQFKQEVLDACGQPGASVAGVVLAFGVNANLVRQWRRGRGFRPVGGNVAVPASRVAQETSPTVPSFMSLALPAAQQQSAPTAEIRIELRRGALQANVSWPLAGAAECADWLRELLR